MEWQNLSTGDHARHPFETALLPIGTIEAHNGGPVGTDNLIPEALCRHLSTRLELPTLPLMPYGITGSLLAYPGGCSLSEAVLDSFLFELGRSLARHGLKRLLVINGHGGNTATLEKAAGRLFREINLYVAVIDWWFEGQPDAVEIFGEGGMGHAGIDEMGLLLGLHPEIRNHLPQKAVPAYYRFKGVTAIPTPRPVIIYDHPESPVDFARLTEDKCTAFADRILHRMEEIIRNIMTGWDTTQR
ncbi:MAG: creatininase family protein [Candidatus Eisenbacteria bacterium]|uniref:Creatininase family protein n=1 Tax=Eiseniibacteriota bacterium TaxID=2212470 RepID=A0A948W4R1_UNCEI|nr:creatininase family protein [Candidatus Eisenbacteria bacterium]MBU1951111.1 creatininase family protein [Candidatus Eisenbacteria bacterium]MBU2692497.1 creatininase family protein [Candidatus Eisenbacteria bacterium]